MSSRTLLNLILAGVALLLGLVVMYQPGLEEPSAAAPIANLPADSISSIRITRKERTPLVFTKTASGWQLLKEQALPASEFQVRALLGIPSSRPGRSYPVSDLDPGSAGLDPPQATLLLNDILIDVGNTEPLDKKRYIRHDDTVYLVTDIYQHLINADWTNFVERRLLPEKAALTGIELPGLSLTMDNDGLWQTSAAAVAADTRAIQALVGRWQAASASFIRRYDGTATTDSITLTFSDDTEAFTLYINEQAAELVLARPDRGLQYHFPADMRARLLDLSAPQATIEGATDQQEMPLQLDGTATQAPSKR